MSNSDYDPEADADLDAPPVEFFHCGDAAYSPGFWGDDD